MEVINSGSQQHDIMELYHDWFGMLNGGHKLTPVGSSDSHDVGRFIVGQARTYVKQEGTDPGRIDTRAVTDSFLAGKVNVSFGLYVEMEKWSKGPVGSGKISLRAQVRGPSWITAEKVILYANGNPVREFTISRGAGKQAGIKWGTTFTIDKGKEKMHLVLVALGPPPNAPWWLIPRPYQRRSVEWKPSVIGSTGALWVN
jgi:hypothetical protein